MKLKFSLKTKVVTIILLFTLLLSAITVLLSYTFYTRSFNEHYESLATSISKTTASVLDTEKVRALTAEVARVYREICDEHGGLPDFDSFTEFELEAYYARFEYITETEEYTALLGTLQKIREDNGVRSLYLGYTDIDTLSDLYLVDASDEGDACIPGDCDAVEEQHVDKVKNGDYTLPAYITNYAEYGWLCTAGAPVVDADGNVICVAYVDISMDQIVAQQNTFLWTIGLIVAAAAIVMLILVIVLTDRAILKPIGKLGHAAESYSRSKEAGENETKEFSRLSIRTGDEIEELHRSLVQMESDIGSYIRTVTAVTAEKERVGAELDVAARIQASMLPCSFPAFPHRAEFEVYATMSPAKEVGGDFYDFFMVDEDNLAVVVADVSGKGVPAALFMVIGKTLIKDHTSPGKDLGEVFTEVNSLLCEANSEELFITAFVGVLNLRSGEFRYVNAGHEPPFISRRGRPFALHKIRAAFVLGGMEGMKYKAGVFRLEPGDKIFQYTDGVTEATDKDEHLFGMDRLQSSLARVSGKKPEEILSAVKSDIDEFAGDTPQFDDITMLCLEFKEYSGKGEGRTVEVTLDSMAELTEYAETVFEDKGVPMGAVTKMNIALDEIFSNIVKFSGASFVKVTCGVEKGDTAYMSFADDGKPYDPLGRDDPDITLSAEERDVGGLGIYMVKKSMTSVTYEYAEGNNNLTLKLKF